MQTFKAKLGTTFRYHDNLHGEIYVQASKYAAMQIPAEDFMQFAAFVSGLPEWNPRQDAYDQETSELMVKHVETCGRCTFSVKCPDYWKLITDRMSEKERRRVQ